jgi:hypothetical protein
MFVGEVRSLCKNGALKVLHLGMLWPYQETFSIQINTPCEIQEIKKDTSVTGLEKISKGQTL